MSKELAIDSSVLYPKFSYQLFGLSSLFALGLLIATESLRESLYYVSIFSFFLASFYNWWNLIRSKYKFSAFY